MGKIRSLKGLLKVRLFYKLLVANAVVVAGAISITAWLLVVRSAGDPSPVVWGLFGIALLAIALGANALVVRIALSPLRTLEETARAVSSGDRSARAMVSPLADRNLERLILSFNDMVDQLAHHHTRLEALSARCLHAQEEERKRVARELHDDTGQVLAAILLRLRLLSTRAQGSELQGDLESLREALVDSIEGLRRFARGLRPPALSELGLVPAIDAYLREIAGDHPTIRLRFRRAGTDPRLAPAAELAAYRIVQEAVSNSWRHGAPAQIDVSLNVTRQGLEIVVQDDGHGFDVDGVSTRGDSGLGLLGMAERAAHVGGAVRIQSSGEGTAVLVRIPAERGSPTDREPPAAPRSDAAACAASLSNSASQLPGSEMRAAQRRPHACEPGRRRDNPMRSTAEPLVPIRGGTT